MARNGGIYKMTNKITGGTYIGSSKYLMSRKSLHFSDLKNNKRHSHAMQHDFNLHGRRSFLFEVLEIINEITGRKFAERKYIEHLNPSYNTVYAKNELNSINKKGISNRMKGNKHGIGKKYLHT